MPRIQIKLVHWLAVVGATSFVLFAVNTSIRYREFHHRYIEYKEKEAAMLHELSYWMGRGRERGWAPNIQPDLTLGFATGIDLADWREGADYCRREAERYGLLRARYWAACRRPWNALEE